MVELTTLTTGGGPDTLIILHPTTAAKAFIPDTNLTDITTNTTNNATAATFYPEVDITLGAVAIMFSVIGILGNILSCLHFRQHRKKSLHHGFYALISLCDALTAAGAFPVIASLLTMRSSVLFAQDWLCSSWPVYYYLGVRVSMSVVVLLSVTRTISIVSPFQQMKHHGGKMLVGAVLYAVLLLTIDVVFLSFNWVEPRFYSLIPMCEISAVKSEDSFSITSRIYSLALQIELILPCLVVLISFIVSAVVLIKRRPDQYTQINTKSEKNFRKVSVTIAIFTALFLVCFLPCFLLQLVYFLSMFSSQSPEFMRVGTFKFYAHLVSQFLLPLTNSAANPVLYLTRMKQLRMWCWDVWYEPSKMFHSRPYSQMGGSLKTGSTRASSSSTRSRASTRFARPRNLTGASNCSNANVSVANSSI